MKKLAFLALLLMFSFSVFAQKTAPKPTPKVLTEREQRILLQKFQAVSMVTKTAGEATFWEDKWAGGRSDGGRGGFALGGKRESIGEVADQGLGDD